ASGLFASRAMPRSGAPSTPEVVERHARPTMPVALPSRGASPVARLGEDTVLTNTPPGVALSARPSPSRPSGPPLEPLAFGTGAAYTRRSSTPQPPPGEHGSQATGATASRPTAPSSGPRS